MGATIKIDGNVFENSKNPIGSYYSDEVGYWDLGENTFDTIEWVQASGGDITAGPDPESTVSYDPPYEYSLVPLADVRAHVAANAGAGKIADCL
jgi:pectate lyase